MSMIPADFPAILAPTAMPVAGARRLPRALGWLSAAVVSGGLWCVAIEVVRLIA